MPRTRPPTPWRSSGGSFASDNDPELIRAAAPFSLKLMDSVLEEQPRHVALLTAAARGYTQYAYAYVQMDGEELEDQDIALAAAKFGRARLLYVRAPRLRVAQPRGDASGHRRAAAQGRRHSAGGAPGARTCRRCTGPPPPGAG